MCVCVRACIRTCIRIRVFESVSAHYLSLSFHFSFRYGALAKLFGDRTLRDILKERGWRVNPQPTTVQSSGRKRDAPLEVSSLRKKLEMEKKRRSSTIQVNETELPAETESIDTASTEID